MPRRYISCFCMRMFVFIFFFIAAACNSNSGNSGPASDGPVAKSALTRDIAPQVTDADLSAAVGGNTDFALKAFVLLDPGGGTNTVFSPYSITQALALSAAGAGGTTLSGIERALSFSLPQERLNPAFNKLDLLLAAKTTGAIGETGRAAPRLNIVNAIWGQQGFPLLPAYLDTIALNYGAGLRLVDFIQATEAARSMINSWVAGQTNGRITNLLPAGAVTADTRVVLTNAIWFKAEWLSPFFAEDTHDGPFTGRNGVEATVPFLHQTLLLPYALSNGCQAVDLPYVEGNLSMLVLMPAPGTFDAFLAAFTPAELAEITNLLVDRPIALALPKFTFSAEPQIGPILSTLGMADAFDPAKADLSGMDGRRDLFISAVIHKAFISIDEQGTEAAAATGGVVGTTGIIIPDLVLTVDHPFIFLIRDRQTGLILFMGKVVSL